MVSADDALRRATALFTERVKDSDRWDGKVTRSGTFHTRRGQYQGWFITFHRRPDAGEEQDWRTTLGIEVFVNDTTGRAEMMR
jgi:hypothetical protein